MTIQVTCDNCGKVVKANDEYAGKKGKCPGCSSVLLIPAQRIRHAEPDEAEFPWQSESVPAQKTRHAEADDQGGAAERLRPCPACGEEIKQAARKCRYCGEVLDPNYMATSGSNQGHSSRQRSSSHPTADLGKRFLGRLADAFAGFGGGLPGLVLAVMMDAGGGSPAAGVALALVGALAVMGMQFYLLATRSQSIGKCWVKTQIYDYKTNAPANAGKSIGRELFNVGIGLVPVIGGLIALAGYCFIFGEERRCLHDLVAGTYVVNIS